MLGDEAQQPAGDEALIGDGPRTRPTSGPRHAAPRKSLLTKLHVPAGKAVALAAMPTAVLMGMGLTPHLAQADDNPSGSSPFKAGPCVTQSDTPSPTDSTASGKDSGSTAKDGSGTSSASATPDPSASPGASDGGTPSASPSASATKATESSTTAAPKSTPTTSPTPSPSPTQSNPDLLSGLGNLLGGLLGGGSSGATPTPTPSTTSPAPTPSASASTAPDPGASTAPSASSGSAGPASGSSAASEAGKTVKGLTGATGTASPSASPSATPSASSTGGTQSYPCPTSDPAALANAQTESGIPLLPDQPWTLKTSKLFLHGLKYDGIVQVQTWNGTVKDVLKFTATGIDIDNLQQIVQGPNGSTTHVNARQGSTSTFRNGTVTMYTQSISGNLLGLIPITFTPDFPPPLVLPELFFTNATVIQAGQFGGTLTVPGMEVLPNQPAS